MSRAKPQRSATGRPTRTASTVPRQSRRTVAGRWRVVEDRGVTTPLRRGAALALALGLALPLAVLAAGPAAAEPPIDVAGEITDTAQVLGDRTAEVQAALDQLTQSTPYQLFVVFVDSFDGADGLDWANETATVSGLGVNDLLLAVAVEDRRYGISVDNAIDLTDDQLSTVAYERVEPRLGDSDWAGAAIAAADGYRDAAAGGSGSGAGSSGFPWIPLLVVGAAVVLIVVIVRSRRTGAPAGSRGPDGRPVEGLAALPTEELNRRASRALVAVDDAIKTSEQELGFAEAQFGLEATRTFGTVLTESKARTARAFTLRQQLDDSVPETEPQRRGMLLEILALCDQVDTALDAQADEFDRLRDLQARAPQVLQETDRRAVEVQGRLPAAQVTLDQLATTYPPASLASVSGNVAQAAALLDNARAGVAQGTAVVDSDRGAAVALARAAEDAVAQSVTLLDAVERAGKDLAAAGARIDAALASLGADVADAARLAPHDPAVTTAADVARQAIASAQAERSTGDPLAALRRLTEAETALDAALAPARDQAEQLERARGQLGQVLGRLGSQIRAVSEFIETRRGAVGAEARTRLAEAARLAQHAERSGGSDPLAALAAAQHAEQLAAQAQRLAEADVARWQQQQQGGFGGGFGGGTGGPSAGSLILGGILLDQILGGGRSGGFGGGGFGGGRSGGFGGSFGGGRSGGRSAGSFGGGGSRGRRGGGGRF